MELSPPGGREDSQQEDVVWEANEPPRSELIEDGLRVQVEAGGDGVNLRHRDQLKLVQTKVLGLLLPRGYRPGQYFTNMSTKSGVPFMPTQLYTDRILW